MHVCGHFHHASQKDQNWKCHHKYVNSLWMGGQVQQQRSNSSVKSFRFYLIHVIKKYIIWQWTHWEVWITRFPSSVYDTNKKTCFAINVNKWQMYHNPAVWPQRVKKQVEVGQLIYLLWIDEGRITVTTRTSRRPPPASPQSLLKINTCSICTQDISFSPRLLCLHNYYISTVF